MTPPLQDQRCLQRSDSRLVLPLWNTSDSGLDAHSSHSQRSYEDADDEDLYETLLRKGRLRPKASLHDSLGKHAQHSRTSMDSCDATEECSESTWNDSWAHGSFSDDLEGSWPRRRVLGSFLVESPRRPILDKVQEEEGEGSSEVEVSPKPIEQQEASVVKRLRFGTVQVREYRVCMDAHGGYGFDGEPVPCPLTLDWAWNRDIPLDYRQKPAGLLGYRSYFGNRQCRRLSEQERRFRVAVVNDWSLVEVAREERRLAAEQAATLLRQAGSIAPKALRSLERRNRWHGADDDYQPLDPHDYVPQDTDEETSQSVSEASVADDNEIWQPVVSLPQHFARHFERQAMEWRRNVPESDSSSVSSSEDLPVVPFPTMFSPTLGRRRYFQSREWARQEEAIEWRRNLQDSTEELSLPTVPFESFIEKRRNFQSAEKARRDEEVEWRRNLEIEDDSSLSPPIDYSTVPFETVLSKRGNFVSAERALHETEIAWQRTATDSHPELDFETVPFSFLTPRRTDPVIEGKRTTQPASPVFEVIAFETLLGAKSPKTLKALEHALYDSDVEVEDVEELPLVPFATIPVAHGSPKRSSLLNMTAKLPHRRSKKREETIEWQRNVPTKAGFGTLPARTTKRNCPLWSDVPQVPLTKAGTLLPEVPFLSFVSNHNKEDKESVTEASTTTPEHQVQSGPPQSPKVHRHKLHVRRGILPPVPFTQSTDELDERHKLHVRRGSLPSVPFTQSKDELDEQPHRNEPRQLMWWKRNLPKANRRARKARHSIWHDLVKALSSSSSDSLDDKSNKNSWEPAPMFWMDKVKDGDALVSSPDRRDIEWTPSSPPNLHERAPRSPEPSLKQQLEWLQACTNESPAGQVADPILVDEEPWSPFPMDDIVRDSVEKDSDPSSDSTQGDSLSLHEVWRLSALRHGESPPSDQSSTK